MKAILTTLFAAAITSIALAQNSDKALTKVSYNFNHIQDTTQKDRPYKETMLLVVGKNASVYTSYDKINQNLRMAKQFEEQRKNQAGSAKMSFTISGEGNGPTSPVDYFYFAKENKFFTKERVYNNYIVEEPTEKINWKITKDTISFSGIHCQKALTHFKGRNWIAWYATELPFQSGPWKLNGLPGLIIEAYDETKTVQFQFAGMENVVAQAAPAKTTETIEPKVTMSGGSINVIATGSSSSSVSPYLEGEIKLPADAIRASRKELDKLKDARDKDPAGFMKTQSAGNGGMITVTGFAMPRTAESNLPKIVLNNPVELPEKK